MKAHTNKCCSDTGTPCDDVFVDIQAKLTHFMRMVATFPQRIFQLEFLEILHQNISYA